MSRMGPAGFLFYIGLGITLALALGFLLSGSMYLGGLGAALAIPTVPRLRDIGRSGWWASIIVLFAPAAIALFEAGEPLWGALASFPLAAIIGVLSIIPGKGANRYGQPPTRWYG